MAYAEIYITETLWLILTAVSFTKLYVLISNERRFGKYEEGSGVSHIFTQERKAIHEGSRSNLPSFKYCFAPQQGLAFLAPRPRPLTLFRGQRNSLFYILPTERILEGECLVLSPA